MTNYQTAKKELKETAIWFKTHYPNDKPRIRQGINDRAYFLRGEHRLSPKEIDLLDNYACTLHS